MVSVYCSMMMQAQDKPHRAIWMQNMKILFLMRYDDFVNHYMDTFMDSQSLWLYTCGQAVHIDGLTEPMVIYMWSGSTH